MRASTRALLGAALLGIAGGSFLLLHADRATAADHLDPPSRVDVTVTPSLDQAADIADVFAWHQGAGANARMVTILTFAGPNAPVEGQATPCDPDVLYTIHISNGATQFDLRARFAKDDVDGCFVQLMGVPGAGAGAIEGPTERPFRRRGVDVFAGLRDDPFFFDLTGFRQTLASGTISMINDRDFFSGMNTSALVVEFPLAAVSPGGETLDIWATTARAGGT
jgi:hypothetical protein